MKKNLKSLAFIALTLFASTFISCDKEGTDTTKPTITLGEPVDGEEITAGNTSGVHFEAEFEDDVELGSYKVDIHSNFDGHSHVSALTKSDETVDFSFTQTWDISGQRNASVHHHEIIIPEDATPGNYHMMIYCTDAAGNESYIATSIVIVASDGTESEDDDHDHDHE
ncbi:MAG: DUF4625 domain-containing protein [Rikenellaceae bacterium]